MKREDVFHIGPHIGYIKTYDPKKECGIVVSLNDGREYSFCGSAFSSELWNQFSEEMSESYVEHVLAKTNTASVNTIAAKKREQEYFANELGLLVVGFMSRKSAFDGNNAMDIQFPEKYIQEYLRNLYCFYTRTGQKRFALSVLFKAVPSIEFFVKYKELCDEHLYRYGTEDQVRYYMGLINPEEIISTFDIHYYYHEHTYTPPFGDERTRIESGYRISYKSPEFPFNNMCFTDSYLKQLEEECEELCTNRTNSETDISDSLLAREYIKDHYSKEKHLNSLLERIPVKFSEFNALKYVFNPVNDVERQIKLDDLSFCIDDPMAEIIAQIIQDSPNLKIKDSVEVLSFLESE